MEYILLGIFIAIGFYIAPVVLALVVFILFSILIILWHGVYDSMRIYKILKNFWYKKELEPKSGFLCLFIMFKSKLKNKSKKSKPSR